MVRRVWGLLFLSPASLRSVTSDLKKCQRLPKAVLTFGHLYLICPTQSSGPVPASVTQGCTHTSGQGPSPLPQDVWQPRPARCSGTPSRDPGSCGCCLCSMFSATGTGRHLGVGHCPSPGSPGRLWPAALSVSQLARCLRGGASVECVHAFHTSSVAPCSRRARLQTVCLIQLHARPWAQHLGPQALAFAPRSSPMWEWL